MVGRRLTALGAMVAWAATGVSVASGQCELLKVPSPSPTVTNFGTLIAGRDDVFAIGNSPDSAESPDWAVYAFRRHGATLVNEGTLVSDPPINPNITSYGSALAVDGDRILVGDQTFNNFQGKVFLFERVGGSWTQTARFDGVVPNAQFGGAVAIEGDFLAIGAPWETASPGEGPFGVVYVYRRQGTVWTFIDALFNPNGDPSSASAFGGSLAMEGGRLIVGAPNEFDCGIGDCGSAFVYRMDPTGPVFENTLSHDPALDFNASGFAKTVDIDGTVAVVGAWDAGAVFVFRFDGTNWVRSTKLSEPPFAAMSSDYGLGVAVQAGGSGQPDTIVVGAGNELMPPFSAGSVFVYQGTSATAWTRTVKLRASDREEGQHFGDSVAISGESILIGAKGTNRGAVYLFGGINDDCDADGVKDLCEIDAGAADANTDGIPDSCQTVACAADFDGNNAVEVADIFAFLSAWFAQSPTANFDANPAIEVSDIFAFLSAWFAGCP